MLGTTAILSLLRQRDDLTATFRPHVEQPLSSVSVQPGGSSTYWLRDGGIDKLVDA